MRCMRSSAFKTQSGEAYLSRLLSVRQHQTLKESGSVELDISSDWQTVESLVLKVAPLVNFEFQFLDCKIHPLLIESDRDGFGEAVFNFSEPMFILCYIVR